MIDKWPFDEPIEDVLNLDTWTEYPPEVHTKVSKVIGGLAQMKQDLEALGCTVKMHIGKISVTVKSIEPDKKD